MEAFRKNRKISFSTIWTICAFKSIYRRQGLSYRKIEIAVEINFTKGQKHFPGELTIARKLQNQIFEWNKLLWILKKK